MSTHIPTSTNSSREIIDRSTTVYQEKCGNFDIYFEFTDAFWNIPVEEEPMVAMSNESPTTEHPSEQTVSSVKHTLSKLVEINLDEIPPYLAKNNPTFAREIRAILPMTKHLEQIRSIAILMYKLLCLEMVHSLWMIYQRSGKGELTTTTTTTTVPMDAFVNRKVWPQEVYSFIPLEEVKSSEDEELCLNLVHDCLRQVNEKSEEYRRELRVSTSSLSNYTPQIEEIMEKIIRRQLIYLRIEFDYQIALVHYSYTDQLLRRYYSSLTPTGNQVHWLERLCQLKYEEELTRRELHLLKDKIPMHLSLHPFDSQSIVQLPFTNKMSKPTLQQQLYFQYKTIMKEVKMNRLNNYFSSFERQICHYQQQFQQEMNEIERINRSLPRNQQLSGIMRTLIDERLANITARTESMYKFKEELFHLKSMSRV